MAQALYARVLVGLGVGGGATASAYLTGHIIHVPWSHKSKDAQLIDISRRRRAKSLLQGVVHDPAKDWGIDFRDVSFRNERGETLRGWYVPPRRSKGVVGALMSPINWVLGRQEQECTPDICLVTVHGGGNDRRDWLRHLPLLHQQKGCGVLMFDCSSHGASEGLGGVSLGVREHVDVLAAARLTKESLGAGKCVIIGTSQGAASSLIAGAVSEPGLVDGIIAENAFADAREAVFCNIKAALGGGKLAAVSQSKKLSQDPFTRLLFTVKSYIPEWYMHLVSGLAVMRMGQGGTLTPLEAVSQLPQSMPLLLLHGTEDEMVPTDHSERMYEAANSEKKSLWVCPNTGHMQLFNTHPQEYAERLSEFLQLVRDP